MAGVPDCDPELNNEGWDIGTGADLYFAKWDLDDETVFWVGEASGTDQFEMCFVLGDTTSAWKVSRAQVEWLARSLVGALSGGYYPSSPRLDADMMRRETDR